MSTFVDTLVQRYLKMKGLDDVVNALDSQHQSKKSTENEKMESSEIFSLCQDIVVDILLNGGADHIDHSYDSYRAWACNSLDFVRAELLQLCLPFFVYSYICLIRKSHYNEAKSFWNKNIRLPPDLLLMYTVEINELSLLNTSEQLQEEHFLQSNNFIESSLKNKYEIKISAVAYNLIKAFLLQNELLYLLTILNEKIIVQYNDASESVKDSNLGYFEYNHFPYVCLQGYHTTMNSVHYPVKTSVPSTSSSSSSSSATAITTTIATTATTVNDNIAVKEEKDSTAISKIEGEEDKIATSTSSTSAASTSASGEGMNIDDNKQEGVTTATATVTTTTQEGKKVSDNDSHSDSDEEEEEEEEDDSDKKKFQENDVTKSTTSSVSILSLLPPINLSIRGKKLLHIEGIIDVPYIFEEDLVLIELLLKIVRPRLFLSKMKLLPPSDHSTTATSSATTTTTTTTGAHISKNTAIPTSTSSNTSVNMDVAMHTEDTSTSSTSDKKHKWSYMHNEWIDVTTPPMKNSMTPSILFNTITNTYNEMICMDIDDQIKQVVVGFTNNSVKVFDITRHQSTSSSSSHHPHHHKRMKKGVKDSTSTSNNNNSITSQMMITNTHELIHDLKYTMKRDYDDVLPKPRKDYETLIQTIDHPTYNKLSYRYYDIDYDDNHHICKQEFYGHSKPVYGVSQNIYGRLILSGSADETVRLWDMRLGQCVSKYQVGSVVWDVSFNPLFDCFFTAANQNSTLTIYNTNKTTPIRILLGHTSDVTCTDWSQNGMLLCSGSDDTTCRIWDLRTGICARVLAHSHSPISSVCISKDGRLLASGTDSGTLYIYDIYTMKLLGICKGHLNMVTSVDFSEDSITLVSGSLDGTIRIWNVQEIISQYAATFNVTVPTISTTTANMIGTRIPGKSTPSTINNGDTLLQKHRLHDNLDRLTQQKYDSMLPSDINIYSPLHTYNTKYTPVYYAKYSKQNMIYAGGPFSMYDNDVSLTTSTSLAL